VRVSRCPVSLILIAWSNKIILLEEIAQWLLELHQTFFQINTYCDEQCIRLRSAEALAVTVWML
jgi:hypothetical protein